VPGQEWGGRPARPAEKKQVRQEVLPVPQAARAGRTPPRSPAPAPPPAPVPRSPLAARSRSSPSQRISSCCARCGSRRRRRRASTGPVVPFGGGTLRGPISLDCAWAHERGCRKHRDRGGAASSGRGRQGAKPGASSAPAAASRAFTSGRDPKRLSRLDPREETCIFTPHCGINSVVECQLPKLNVVGSNPISRSRNRR
jgi:hypothetical protein